MLSRGFVVMHIHIYGTKWPLVVVYLLNHLSPVSHCHCHLTIMEINLVCYLQGKGRNSDSVMARLFQNWTGSIWKYQELEVPVYICLTSMIIGSSITWLTCVTFSAGLEELVLWGSVKGTPWCQQVRNILRECQSNNILTLILMELRRKTIERRWQGVTEVMIFLSGVKDAKIQGDAVAPYFRLPTLPPNYADEFILSFWCFSTYRTSHQDSWSYITALHKP